MTEQMVVGDTWEAAALLRVPTHGELPALVGRRVRAQDACSPLGL